MAITNKYSFKQWCHKHYPDILAEPVYGISAYIIDGAMNDIDAFTYYQTQLDNGKYIVFIGLEASEVSKLISKITKDGLPERPANNRKESIYAPTTFTAFEAWLERNHLEYKHRTFQPHRTPQEVLAPLGNIDDIQGCKDVFYSRTWYLYEVDCDGHYFPTLPHVSVGDGTAVLVKASSSHYVSKRERLSVNFNTMQTYMEQLIVALTEENEEHAINAAVLYCATLYECGIDQISVSYQEMKEELSAGKLGIYLRDKQKRILPITDDDFGEDF